MEIKLLKNGIKINNEYYPCWYSSSKNNIKGNATIYMKTFKSLPEEVYSVLQVRNASNMQTDYFEKDRIIIPPDSKFFKIVEDYANAESQP